MLIFLYSKIHTKTMNSNFTVVYSFLYPHEMDIAKHALESHGIKCFSEDNLTVQSYQFISNAVGGVKLIVSNENLEKAIEILVSKGIIPILNKPKDPSTEDILANNLNTLISSVKTIKIRWQIMFFLILGFTIYYFIA